MGFIQGGAEGSRGNFPTKKALKEAVAADPARVYFFCTSPMGGQFDGAVCDLPDNGTKLSVVGPDPFRSRKWYATIEYAVVKGVRQLKVS